MTRPNTRKGIALRIASVPANGLPIRWCEVAEASAVRPPADLQPVIVAAVGVAFFGGNLQWNMVIGAVVVAAARIVTRWNSRTTGQPT